MSQQQPVAVQTAENNAQLHDVATNLPTDGRRIRNPELTLQRLLASARDVFGLHGYERSTVDQIVANAGVSKGAFYNHFSSKEEVFLTLLEQRGAGNKSRFLDACRPCSSPSARAICVVETILGHTQADAGWSALSVEFMAHAMRTEAIAERLGGVDAEWRLLIADLLIGETYTRETCPFDADAIAFTLHALLDGLIMQARLEPDLFALDAVRARIAPLIQAWFPEPAPPIT